MYGRPLGDGTIHRVAPGQHTDVSGIDGCRGRGDSLREETPMMTTKDLDAFFEAGWNGHDVDFLMTFMADDCVFESTAGSDACGTRHVGRERVREAFTRVFAAFPDARFGAVRHFVAGDRGLSEWFFTGTTGDRREVWGHGVKTGAWDVAFLGAEPQRAAEIAFTAAYLEIPSTYIVPAGSPIRSVDEVDRAGVRIAVADQSAYGLYLVRTIKHAKLVLTQGLDSSFDVFVSQKLEALAGLKPRLLTDVQKLPGARILDGQFTAVQQSIGTPKNREASARFLRAFVEEVKASGLVAEAISRNGAQGVTVAPPAPAQ